MLFRRPIPLLSAADIEQMRAVGKLAADTLCAVDELIAPGIATRDIDRFVHEYTLAQGARPAPLGYRGFPRSCCISINEVVCHGIPDDRLLADGDIVNVDVTHVYEGFYGDTSATFYVGTPSREAVHVTEVSRECLRRAIATVGPGAHLGDIGAAVQEFAETRGCSVVRDYTGHGIGRVFHGPPTIRHRGRQGAGREMLPGMAFTIEPMINLGTWQVSLQPDKWTVLTRDRRLSAQFEHTLVVTDHGCEVLTERSRPLSNSERFSDYLAQCLSAERAGHSDSPPAGILGGAGDRE